MNETAEQYYQRMGGGDVLRPCPSCNQRKPVKEVRSVYYCRASQGLEVEEMPCVECRERLEDGGSAGVLDPRTEATV